MHDPCTGDPSWPALSALFPEASPPPPVLGRSLEGERVLLTGAGGSIGRVLTEVLLSQSPARLTLLDSSEQALSALGRQLSLPVSGASDPIRLCLGDLRTEIGRARALAGEPTVVIHTAAYKGVPLLEGQPVAAVENNLLALLQWARECQEEGVGRFVFLSTDKAVAPVSVMGATKRLAEQALLCAGPGILDTDSPETVSSEIASSESGPMERRVLRLCNVWGSQGSVVPRFWRRLQSGRPLEVTDPAMRRFWPFCSKRTKTGGLPGSQTSRSGLRPVRLDSSSMSKRYFPYRLT